MGERADQIEQQINRTRENLGENFNELEQKVKGAFDWRTQFDERPMTLLAIAFGGGVIASALLPSRSSRRRRYVEQRREYRTSEPAKETSTDNVKRGNSSEGVDALKGALITVAASRLGGMVGDLLSGYRDELRKFRQTQHK
ncbi:MAG TPA: hypothetical protein VK703_16550 [Candidatus Acidoferrales bacterium]|jgi:hypothetical protein|nr:hypothetical protein [Candidatus Acidoferrales bacterium]